MGMIRAGTAKDRVCIMDHDELVDGEAVATDDDPALAFIASVSEEPWDGSASGFTDEQWFRSTLVHTNGTSRVKADNKLPIRTPSGALSRAGVHAAAARLSQVDAAPELLAAARRALRAAYKELREEPPEAITAGITSNPSTEDGPGWFTHPVDTDRLRDYWTHGKGAAKIGWGAPGDFHRCEVNLAKYVKPQYLQGYCANRHFDALGFWPGDHKKMVASVRIQDINRKFFENPNLQKPTPLTITDDGHIFGHVADWSRAHIGYSTPTYAPKSPSNYKFFRLGATRVGGLTADGGEDIPTGVITLGTGHPDLGVSAQDAIAHYDNTGTAVADIATGDDQFGIWFSGMIRDLDAKTLRILRAAKISGDWRPIDGHNELIAALCVNVPGIPIPRTDYALAASAVAGETAVVGINIVGADEVPQEPVDIAQAVAAELDRREAWGQVDALIKQDTDALWEGLQ